MKNRQKSRSDKGQFIIPLSAQKQENLNQYVSDLLNYLQSSQEEINLNSMAYTLQVGRVPMFWRVVFVVWGIHGFLTVIQAGALVNSPLLPPLPHFPYLFLILPKILQQFFLFFPD